ncbi:MAG: DUF2012 domain-containing protein, partial [Nitrospirae bacterium]|nr:DUF2012 domain-containing protein [Nitrospirota bacterium]
ISGTVSTSSSAAISGVTVSLSGTQTGTTTTNSSGNFSFSSLSNGSYTLTPSLTGYTFSPTSKTVTVSSANLTGQNFTGTATSTTGKTSKIGAYGSGAWLLDYQGTGTWAGCGAPSDTTKDECFSGFGWESDDMPVVGDWNGDGRSKIGVYRSSTGAWYLDYSGTGSWIGCGAPTDPTKDACYYFGWSGATPVVGDWNGDGRSKIGAYGNGTWLLDYPGTGSWTGCGAPSDTTKDACFGGFGWSSTDVPVVG